MPASYYWTNGAGNGLWNTAANWTDAANSSHHAVPGSSDTANFGFGGTGSDASCTVNLTSTTVTRVIMDSSYAGSLSVPFGTTLNTSSYFEQDSTLVLNGTVNVGDYMAVDGTVTTTAPRAANTFAVLDVESDLFLNSGGSIVVAGTPTVQMPAPPSMDITSAGITQAGFLGVGGMGATLDGIVAIHGPYTQESGGTTSVYHDALLGFDPDGSVIPPTFEGTTVIGAGSTATGGATIATDTQLDISFGAFTSVGDDAANSIAGPDDGGNVAIYNGGSLTLAMDNTLEMTTGSLTVGASAPDLSATGGNLNLSTDSILTFPTTTGDDTFLVKSGGGGQGIVNMYGAAISMDTSRVATMELSGGTLNSMAAIADFDYIVGNLLNSGTVAFAGGAMHGLNIDDASGGGAYTQTSGGTLSMRLANSALEDLLAVDGATTLGGTLTLSPMEALTAGQAWVIIVPGAAITTNFATINFPPDGNPNWLAGLNVAGNYQISN